MRTNIEPKPVQEVIEGTLAQVTRYRSGERGLLTFFISEIMSKSKGKAAPGVTRSLLLQALTPN